MRETCDYEEVRLSEFAEEAKWDLDSRKKTTVLVEFRLRNFSRWRTWWMTTFLLCFSSSNSIVKPPSSLFKMHWLRRKTISPILPMFSYQFHLYVERYWEKLAFVSGLKLFNGSSRPLRLPSSLIHLILIVKVAFSIHSTNFKISYYSLSNKTIIS